MILRRAKSFAKDTSGLAAVEFALVLPLMVGVLLLGMDGWMRLNQGAAMRSSLQAAARYYQSGGSDDSAASSLAISSWANPPGDAAVTSARACACGATPQACSSLCAGNALPQTYVTLTATGTYTGLMHGQQTLTATSSLRVR